MSALPGEPFIDISGLAEFASLGSVPTAAPHELLTLAVAALPTARYACLTLHGANDRLRTLACTDDDAEQLDRIQDQLGEGPAMDEVQQQVHVLGFDDLTVESNWTRFAAAASERGIRSLLSVRVPAGSLGVAALTFYSSEVKAFDESATQVATVCGSFLGLLVRGTRDRERAENLEIALETNRLIGTAVGILMARDLLTAEQAFDRLRDVSQRSHRKLRDVADDVVATGALPDERRG